MFENKTYYQKHKAELDKKHKEWARKNRVKVRAYANQYYKDNRDKVIAQTLARRKKYMLDPIKRKQYNKYYADYHRNNPDKVLYKRISVNGKQVQLHRYIMEQHLGRKLSVDEIVHHLDGNKLNNEISNLCLMTKQSHGKYHIQQRTIK